MNADAQLEQEIEALHPLEFSMSGKNSHYHHCDAIGFSQSYAVCLHTLKAINENRIRSDQFVECQRAFCHDTCNAKKMRAEEQLAGHALYYRPRTNINPANTRPEAEAQATALSLSSGKYDMNNPSFARGWNSVGSNKPAAADGPRAPLKSAAAPRSTPTPKPKSGFVEENMAELVNAIASEPKKPDPKPEPAPAPVAAASSPTQTISPLPGESPLQFARRRQALLQKQ